MKKGSRPDDLLPFFYTYLIIIYIYLYFDELTTNRASDILG